VRLIKVSLARFRLKDLEAGASSVFTRSRRSFNKPGFMLYEDRACEGDFIVSARWRGGWAATRPDWFRLPLVVFNPVSFSFPGRDPIPHEEVHVWREAWRVYVLNAVYEGRLCLVL